MRPCWAYWASKKCTKNKPGLSVFSTQVIVVPGRTEVGIGETVEVVCSVDPSDVEGVQYEWTRQQVQEQESIDVEDTIYDQPSIGG